MRSTDFSDLAPATPPPAGYSPELDAIAQRANALLAEHGAVSDGHTFPKRSAARNRAQRVITLLTRMGYRQRWQLGERVRKAKGGFQWFVVLEATNGGDAHDPAGRERDTAAHA